MTQLHSKMKPLRFLLAAPLFAHVCYAQVPTAIQQADSVRDRRDSQLTAGQSGGTNNAVPELYSTETSDIGPQNVLIPRAHRSLFEFAADSQYFYTDNMFLANNNRQEADILVSTIHAALVPSPIAFEEGWLSPRAGYEHQWFNFGLANGAQLNTFDFAQDAATTTKLGSFDFNCSTVFGDISYRRGSVVLGMGADFRRFLDSSSYREFYREYAPRWFARREFVVDSSKGFSIGYEGDYRVTESQSFPTEYSQSFNDRLDNSLVVAGSWKLCDHALLQPFYRFEVSHYTSINRDDFQNSFGLSLILPFTDNFYARGFVGYDNVGSNGRYVNSYGRLDAGAGLNFGLRF